MGTIGFFCCCSTADDPGAGESGEGGCGPGGEVAVCSGFGAVYSRDGAAGGDQGHCEIGDSSKDEGDVSGEVMVSLATAISLEV
jgi:hypothetical protein